MSDICFSKCFYCLQVTSWNIFILVLWYSHSIFHVMSEECHNKLSTEPVAGYFCRHNFHRIRINAIKESAVFADVEDSWSSKTKAFSWQMVTIPALRLSLDLHVRASQLFSLVIDQDTIIFLYNWTLGMHKLNAQKKRTFRTKSKYNIYDRWNFDQIYLNSMNPFNKLSILKYFLLIKPKNLL